MRPCIAALLLVLAVPAGARADTATEAKLRFDLGVQLLQQRKVREALGELFVSNRLSPNPNALFNIGLCLESLGREDEAFSTYSEYLAFEVIWE